MKYTVLGGSGFIGSRLIERLTKKGIQVNAPERSDLNSIAGQDLGHVYFCIGMTGNFRGRPAETLAANLGILQHVFEACSFDSLLYLSSTRVYGTNSGRIEVDEDTPLSVIPGADSTYDLSKLTAESLCLSSENPAVRVARLSNVYGAGQSTHTFLGSLLTAALRDGAVTIRESSDSTKDYVYVDDVVDALVQISQRGQQRLYNVASGRSVTHGDLSRWITMATNSSVTFASGGPLRRFPSINTARLQTEFPGACQSLLSDHISNITRYPASGSAA